MSLKTHERFVAGLIESWGGLPEIDEIIEAIMEYRTKEDWYESKAEMLSQWDIDHEGVWELVIAIFTASITQEYLTLQSMVGMLNHRVKMDDEIDRVKIIADIIGICIHHELIEMHSKNGEMFRISCTYEVEEEIPEWDKHAAITKCPPLVQGNFDRAGGTGSVILGHPMNHHEGDLRLSHLRRMSRIAFRVDKEFVEGYEEARKHDPETEEEWEVWEKEKAASLAKYEELMANNTTFFLRHAFDSRGRSYSRSWHLNPQGSSYKKAVVQLADMQTVEGWNG